MDWQSENAPSQPRPADVETIDPRPGHAHTHTIICLHGRGDTAFNFKHALVNGGSWLDSQGRTPMDILPSCRWVFPTAGVKPCARAELDPAAAAWLPRSMSQWFDIWDHTNPREREDLQLPGLRESVARVREVVRVEAERLDGRWDRVVLLGISQGGATAAHVLLNLNIARSVANGDGEAAEVASRRRLAAVVGVACRLPFPGLSLAGTRSKLGLDGIRNSDEKHQAASNGVDDEVLRNTPVMLQHCANDPMVKFESGKQLRDSLRGFGAKVVWKEYPDGGHWFKSPQGLEDLSGFLNEVLPKD